MDFSVWELPGPRRFITDIVDDLREGRNVIIVLPKYLPRGFFVAVRDKLDRESVGLLERYSAQSISQSSPVYDLHQVYNSALGTQGSFDIQSLCRCENFKSRLIWIEDIEQLGKKSTKWFDFLKNYAVACGSQDIINRTVFAVPIYGKLTIDDLPKENLLTQHWFWGRASSLDLQIYSAQMLSSVEIETLDNRLLIYVITSLCGFDFETAENLCRLSLSEETELEAIVKNIADQRDWDDSNISMMLEEIDELGGVMQLQNSNKPSQSLVQGWSEGILDRVDGRVTTSPIAEIARGNDEEISLRIWRGHVQSLLPIVDEYRMKVIHHLHTNYRINFNSWNKNNQDILEIGAIKYHIESDPKLRRRIDKDLLSLIQLLTKIRNDLAHLTPVSKERRIRLEEAIKSIY